MALSTSSTPKNIRKPTLHQRTPNNQDFATPRITPKRLQRVPSTSTPECFNKVYLETPVKRRNSNKERFDEVSNLTVAVRIRPMNGRELATVGAQNAVKVKNQELIIRSCPVGNSALGLDHIFQYDHVFWSCDESSPLYSSQEDVFMTIGKPLLNSAFKGYNACLFAYGQTGSGKSFSMMGRNNFDIIDIDSEEHSGIIPRFCRDLFERINKLKESGTIASVEVSYFEIYNEKIHDLLAEQTIGNKLPLKVREHPEWGPYVVDLSANPVREYKELRNWLILGNKNRATAATYMNEKSSRSHSIFSIELCLSDSTNTDSSHRSKVSLVDLAGSERLSTGHNNDEKLKQGVSINKSLLTLGKVISALADQKKNQFVPYRDSVLTWLLKESLGGNSLTSMLATITPANSYLDETLATLRYACQARSIVNRAKINENPHDRLIRELRSEVERLNALKLEYERQSLSSTNLSLNNSCGKEEIEDLRLKLLETEEKLLKAEKNWKQRFMESEEMKLKELAESEKRREELESQFRVLKTAENTINLSPYKTNFLQELEGVLTDEDKENLIDNNIQNIVNYCYKNRLDYTLSSNIFTIIDQRNGRQAFFIVKDIPRENICGFIRNLTWTDLEIATTITKKISKSEIVANLKQIYEALSNLQPNENDNNLNLLFAKVNKSLQSFEAALLNNCKNNCKSVTFNL